VRILLDTNGYTDFCRNDARTVRTVRGAEAVFLPFVTVAELRAGFRCGTVATRNEAVLAGFMSVPRVRVLFADEPTTRVYAELFAQLRHQGTPVPTNDLWIAALAVQHNLTVCSRDAHFDHFPQIPRC